MARRFRTVLFSLLLGFHNALEGEESALEAPGVLVRTALPDPNAAYLAHPARCFFWNASSLLN